MARFLDEVGNWPDIVTIRRFADEAANGSAKLWSDALADVRQAIRWHGSYGREAALASLDDVTRETVKALGGWAKVCELADRQCGGFQRSVTRGVLGTD